MDIEKIYRNGQNIVVVKSTNKIIIDTRSALDFLMSIKYDTESSRVALNKEAIMDDFFILSSGIAG